MTGAAIDPAGDRAGHVAVLDMGKTNVKLSVVIVAAVVVTLAVNEIGLALNFRAELGNHPHEMNKWNAYQASLSRGGRVVASRDFNVNYTGTVDMPPAHPELAITMLTWRVAESGEYALAIRPLKPPEVDLRNPRLEVRRNVQLPQ